MVSKAVAAASSDTAHTPKESINSTLATGKRQSAPISSETALDGFQIVRENFKQSGVSEERTSIIMDSWHVTTKTQYRSYINRWWQFCGSG